jgi:hypothetical protein
VRSLRWTIATAGGFALGGATLHSPGASAVGASFLDWDVAAAVFGAILGSIVGVVTGVLQMLALARRGWRLVVAAVVAVAIAHALADGAPAAWGVAAVAAISGLGAAMALAWALRTRAWRWITASALAWWAGWMLAVAIASGLGLSGGTTPVAWTTEHVVIAIVLGFVWGAVTSPAARRLLDEGRLPRSAP